MRTQALTIATGNSVQHTVRAKAEPSTEIIGKGKAGRPNEFSKLVKLQMKRYDRPDRLGVGPMWAPPSPCVQRSRRQFRRGRAKMIGTCTRTSLQLPDPTRLSSSVPARRNSSGGRFAG